MLRAKFHPDDLFVGGGQMGAAMRSHDWSRTTLGPVDLWPHSLRVAVRILLGSSYPIYIAWGPEYIQFYNDSYLPILGIKHPAALGKPTPYSLPEIWNFIGPMFDRVLIAGESIGFTDQILYLERNGYPEECYFTFSYSPIPGDDPGVTGGVFVTALETTERVIEERRLRLLRDLAARCAEAHSADEVFRVASATLGTDLHDIPFSLVYAHDRSTGKFSLAGSADVPLNHPLAPAALAVEAHSPWPVAEASSSRSSVRVSLANEQPVVPQHGPWTAAPKEAVLVPILLPSQETPVGFIAAGINPHKQFEGSYPTFIQLVARQMATSIADARGFEEERRRAEELAALDRAKTTFFSNISHELRTPLTLLLAPVEDALQGTLPQLAIPRDQLELVHRNGMRLLRLVNTLLDFSRIEAGRVQASYSPTDIGSLTADLASTFRTAIEKAGLRLDLDLAEIGEPVYVDREMWEKIVLNLLSNAIKFTMRGSISLTLRSVGDELEFAVADTGCGIPQNELPRIFDRFHRVEGTRGRTFEGTGIGLALVQELVRLHGGTVSAESEIDRGTRLCVRIPLGCAHLPPQSVRSTNELAQARIEPLPFLQQSMDWKTSDIPGMPEDSGLNNGAPQKPRVLLADDNVDLRSYIKRLLSPTYEVVDVADGREALEEIRRQIPDLLLSDIMMPGLDGFQLLKQLRAEANTQSLPIIFLSARAGEESRVEGLEAGADDYLIKPFTSRELLARVGTHIGMARIRREASEREAALRAEAELERNRMRQFFTEAPAGIAILSGPEHRWTLVNASYERIVGRKREVLMGKTIRETLPELEEQGFFDLLDNVFQTGKPFLGFEMKAALNRAEAGAAEDAYFNFIYQPAFDASNKVEGVFVLAVDVSEQVLARKAVENSEHRLRLAQKAAKLATWDWDFATGKVIWAQGGALVYGRPESELTTPEQCIAAVFAEDRESLNQALTATISDQLEFDHEFRVVWPDGSLHWLAGRGRAIYDGDGHPARMVGINWDISDRKHAEQVLRRTEQLATAGRLAATVAHEINNPLEAVTNLLYLVQEGIGQMPEGQLRHFLKTADEELQRVSHITRQTLGFYRESSAPVFFEMSELLDEVLGIYSRVLTRKSIRVERNFSPRSEVFAVKGEIRQVLANLIANAIDASPSNSTIQIRLRSFRNGGDADASLIRVTVADQGVGIPRENFGKLFEPFFTTKKSVGTGLGLWVSREIISKHGGSIRLRSRAESNRSGTVISFFLPCSGALSEQLPACAD